jgi:hypothetical protein
MNKKAKEIELSINVVGYPHKEVFAIVGNTKIIIYVD